MKDYKKILEGVVDIINTTEKSDIGFANICTYIGENCHELKESEDEKIRKSIIELLNEVHLTFKYYDINKMLAWLEKQGEQDNNEDSNILQRFSFYSYKDEPNVLYLSGLYVNEECRNKGIGTKILEVADEVAKSLNCHTIRLKTESGSDAERLYKGNGYNTLKKDGNQAWLEKQWEQKSVEWSEEDESLYDYLLGELNASLIDYCGAPLEHMVEAIKWFKSIKDRYTWKPSEVQIEALKEVVDEHFDIDGGVLWHLYEDLKKLREE